MILTHLQRQKVGFFVGVVVDCVFYEPSVVSRRGITKQVEIGYF